MLGRGALCDECACVSDFTYCDNVPMCACIEQTVHRYDDIAHRYDDMHRYYDIVHRYDNMHRYDDIAHRYDDVAQT